MDQITLILNRARQAVLSRDFEFAEELLTSHKTRTVAGDDNKDVLELLGDLYVKSENFPKALSVYEKLNALNPDNLDTLNKLGVIYRRLNQYEDSIEVLKRARELGDNSSTLLYNMGNTYKEMNSYDEAAQCFSEVISMNPDDVLAYNHLGTIEFLNANYDKSLRAYRMGLQRDPNHPFIHFNLARLYRLQEKTTDAEKEYLLSLKNRPAWVQAWDELASLYDTMGETEKRIDTLKHILAIDAKNVKALTDYAEIAVKSERADEAKHLFTRAIEAADSDPKPTLAFADFLHNGKKDTEATGVLEKFNRAYPGSMEIMLNLAELYLSQLQYPKAREIFNECVKIDRDNLKLLSLQGRFYIAIGDNDRARFCLARIFSIAPGKVEFRLEFAEQLAETGLLPEAEEQITAYLNEKPNDHGARILLGAIYEQMKNFERAAACYNAVLAAEKDNFQANAALSLLYQRTGKNADAVRLADEMVNLQGSRASEKDLASLEESITLYEQAVGNYKIANPGVASRNLKYLHPAAKKHADTADEDNLSASIAGMTAANNGSVGRGNETDGLAVAEEDENLGNTNEYLDTNEFMLETESEKEDEDFSDIFNASDIPGEARSLSDDDALAGEDDFLEESAEDFSMPGEDENEILLSDEPAPAPQMPERPYTPPPPPYYPPQPQHPYVPQPRQEEPQEPPVRYQPPESVPEEPEMLEEPAESADIADGTDDMLTDDMLTEDEDIGAPDFSDEDIGAPDFEEPDFASLLRKKAEADEFNPAHHARREDLGPMPPFGFPLRSPVLDLPDLERTLNEIPGENLLELFKYIRKITEALPEKLFSEYLISEERVILEYIIEKLSGNQGIRYNTLAKAVYEKSREARILNGHESGEKILSKTLGFLGNLVSELPDKGFATRLRKQVEDIKTRIESGERESAGDTGSDAENGAAGSESPGEIELPEIQL